MATEGENTSPSSADMFDAAIAAPEPAPAPEPTPQADAQPPRDEQGRFAPKVEPDTPAEPPATVAPEPKQQAHHVPLTELLNEREKRQQYERERDQFRQQAEAYQRQIAALQQPAKPPEPPPDVFENPQGFVGHLDQRFQTVDQRFRNMEVNFSLRLAHSAYKGDFEQAYQSALQAKQLGDPAVAAIYNSSDPGEALMNWHRSRTVLEKTGGNLDSYVEQQIQAKLKDPAFLAKAMEAARAQAQPGQQAPIVELPPSLTRTPGSAATQPGFNGMPSSQELFDQA